MSNARQETIADIVAEMRSNEFDDPSFNVYSLVAARTLARGWADRIEAAHQREVAELKSKMNDVVCENEALRDACGTCGAKREVAELRKGISELLDALQAIYDEECTSYGTGEVYDKWRKALKGVSND